MTMDLLADARPPRVKHGKETPKSRVPIKEAWQEYNDQRMIDDSIAGCKKRLDNVDKILGEIQEYLEAGGKVRRVWTT